MEVEAGVTAKTRVAEPVPAEFVALMATLEVPDDVGVPEPEVMDDSSDVQAYSSAAAEAYLSKIDDTFVEHVLRLIGPAPGWALDIGCGPGQIVMKLSERLPQWKFIGIDRSPAMIHRAVEQVRDRSARSGELRKREEGAV